MMGFDNDIALYALKNVQYRGVGDAIAYLTDQSNGKYVHEFFGLNQDICKLCHEGKDKH